MSAELTSTAPPVRPVAGVELAAVFVAVDGGVAVAGCGFVAVVSRRSGVVLAGGLTVVVSRGVGLVALVTREVSGATAPEEVFSAARLPAFRFCVTHHATNA